MSSLTDQCPHCEASMQGDPIPDEHRQHLDDCPLLDGAERCFCLPWGDKTHFSRLLGHEVSGVYDGVLYWSCPDCGLAWPRWTGGDRRAAQAAHWAEVHNTVARGAA